MKKPSIKSEVINYIQKSGGQVLGAEVVDRLGGKYHKRTVWNSLRDLSENGILSRKIDPEDHRNFIYIIPEDKPEHIEKRFSIPEEHSLLSDTLTIDSLLAGSFIKDIFFIIGVRLTIE